MKRTIRIPRADAAIADGLSARFRSGDLYAYSYEGGTWSTWASEADWLATERKGKVAVPADGRGPTDWPRDELVASLGLSDRSRQQRGMTKAQLITRLRKLADDTPLFDLPDAITRLLGEAA